MKTVSEDLRDMASLYEERNAMYGDNYKRFGAIMMGLFPDGVELLTESDHNRFGVFVQIVAKQTRYAAQFVFGGHADSLSDTAVYSMMLKELDAIPFRDATPFRKEAKLKVTGRDQPMDAPEMLAYVGIDAMRWAEEWIKTIKQPGFEFPNIWDPGFMCGWFANAIEQAKMVGFKQGYEARSEEAEKQAEFSRSIERRGEEAKRSEEQRQDIDKRLPDLVVTRDGVPVADQAAGLREFKARAMAAGENDERARSSLIQKLREDERGRIKACYEGITDQNSAQREEWITSGYDPRIPVHHHPDNQIDHPAVERVIAAATDRMKNDALLFRAADPFTDPFDALKMAGLTTAPIAKGLSDGAIYAEVSRRDLARRQTDEEVAKEVATERRPTIAELQAILDSKDDRPVTIHADGSVTTVENGALGRAPGYPPASGAGEVAPARPAHAPGAPRMLPVEEDPNEPTLDRVTANRATSVQAPRVDEPNNGDGPLG